MLAAQPREFRDLGANYCGAIREQIEWILINVARLFRRPEHREHHRARQCDLDWLACSAAHVGKLLADERSHASQFAGDDKAERELADTAGPLVPRLRH